MAAVCHSLQDLAGTGKPMRFMVDRRFTEKVLKFVVSPLLLLLRTAYSAATGSIQPLEMSAPAGSCKRSRAVFEPEGAPAEADAATAPTEPSRSLPQRLEELRVKADELEVELAANRRDCMRGQRTLQRLHAQRINKSL
jgi:hypothetical protein